ncbi:uncharacterized protein PODANS_7_5580 [Podospora anserina S mat+]|uniref:Podospora anserina S mat+ genomic DNA chromosome 7, supercontig 1 n=1 Tax=Podospora anserina (strain S / ATCC MYA-4624 / DSM 980 / FGSC 10383) TaxID=515849 RepID=B2AW13_PODAN|nr:uncharacterized protein PODANS_7_5580 [Podospora anserina S mat+]CAP68587.1 unnamed protein product [Podospora anserina S mat+]
MAHNSDSMSPPSSSQLIRSGRKGSKKVRTGCITCKIRKVKCDEEKPFCMRCTKTGRRCDGYLDAKAISQRRRRSGGLGQNAAGEPHAPLATLFEWATGDEKRAFHFFQHVTAPCLAADHDGAFFRVLVLQICQTEPAVRHAVLAVSSLHEGMVQAAMMPQLLHNNDSENRSAFALFQYNRAIACLLEQMRTVNARPLVPLLTCVLFVCIELMQSKDKESLIHLEQGRQILSQLGPRVTGRSPEIDLIKQHLVPMYTRMSLTSLMLGCAPTAIPEPLKTLTEVPMVFKTIDEVRYALYDFMDQCLRFAKKSHAAKISKVPEEDMRAFELEQDVLLRKLAKFNVAFSLYRSTKAKEAPPGSIALIQVHVHTTFIWVSTALSRHETVFDDYVDTFSAIIPLASEFINTLLSPQGQGPKGPSGGPDTRRLSAMFTFEMHVIAPLYFVAAKCRHPMIRRAALELLRRNPGRRENLWRANVMATIAEHTMKLEEKHLRSRGERSVSPPGAVGGGTMQQHFPYQFGPGDAWGGGGLEGVPFPDGFLLGDIIIQGNNSNNSSSSSSRGLGCLIRFLSVITGRCRAVRLLFRSSMAGWPPGSSSSIICLLIHRFCLMRARRRRCRLRTRLVWRRRLLRRLTIWGLRRRYLLGVLGKGALTLLLGGHSRRILRFRTGGVRLVLMLLPGLHLSRLLRGMIPLLGISFRGRARAWGVRVWGVRGRRS